MSTIITEYHIHIDGRTMTPAQLFELARGLVEAETVSREDAEWMAADMSARPQKSNETNRVLGKATGQVETLTNYIDRSVAKELVALRRRVRKLERKLRKAAGREKRLVREMAENPFKKIWGGRLPVGIGEGLDDRGLYFVDFVDRKRVVENVNL